RFGPDLRDVLLLDDDVASFLELVALGDLGERHLALALRAPALLLDARLAFGMELVEADAGRGISRREHPHGDVHQADFHEAFPGWACCHNAYIIGSNRPVPHGLHTFSYYYVLAAEHCDKGMPPPAPAITWPAAPR